MNQIITSVSLAILLVTGLVAPCFAADTAALVQRIESQSRAFNTLSTDFTQTLKHQQSGTTETRTGTISFKKPQALRWETTAPSKELIVINDDAIWNYLVDEEVVYKYPLEMLKDSSSILRFVTGQGEIESDFEVEHEGTEDGLTKLHLYPFRPQQTLTEATLWVNETAEIHKVMIVDFYGNENTLTFSNMKFDAPVTDKKFAFTPPKGVDLEDRTSSTVMEKKLFQ
ncbi:LolA family protein [Oleidesulfovibrio sp.]|uniref:LolA family protein n=1 Tax=Oleidesulfovibrio sp. TaxID=2909707 RepID=UPI003A848EF6